MGRDMGKEKVLKRLSEENEISLVAQLQKLGCSVDFQGRALSVQMFISKDLKVKNADLV